MIIRQMRESDSQGVALIEKENFSQPWSANAFCESIKNNSTVFLVAEEVGEILGYIGMYISLDEGEITNVSVSLKHRRKHVATKLIEELKRIALERKVSRIILEVRVTNASAIKTYERQGFKILGTRKNFYEKPVEDAYIMDVQI
ncbi:ribosomal protein S18-alanine N-acetyltransferase [Lachnobacterium bovis]|uniref:ribosomal protein S18-alanine N-acetyltransferase n=1 Tax=Lachnobacterium bovis TaxID=140626 RepID=UPI0003B6DF59|nr:ribosomal protein S18-alanine N-acetyltransferase [Lachnobacterium bovis]